MKHTPGPREAMLPLQAEHGYIADKGGRTILRPYGYKGHIERAEFIVRAVNSHSDLLEACKTFKAMFIREWSEDLWITNHRDIEAAIKKATE